MLLRLTRALNSWIPPVIIDLDGDGIETHDLLNFEILFDLDSDGFKERTGWVSADDAILAIDLDGDAAWVIIGFTVVSAMASMTPPPIGQLELTDAQHAKLDPVLASNWQHA